MCPYMDLNSSSESDPPGASGQAHDKNVATDVIKQTASGNWSSARCGSACLSSQYSGRGRKRVSSLSYTVSIKKPRLERGMAVHTGAEAGGSSL